MARVRSGDIELEAETRGEASGAPLLLLRGLGTQLTQWPDSLLDDLLARGLRLVLMDNRDAGLSDKLDVRGCPSLAELARAAASGATPEVPYRLSDMARDAVAVLDHFGIVRAHAAGISLGGMLVQHLAAGHPERIASAASVMSTSGAAGLPGPTKAALEAVYVRPTDPDDRECVILHAMRAQRAYQGRRWQRSDAELRAWCEAAHDRCHHPAGLARQLAAVVADGSRADLLAGIRVPFLVVHGSDDPLIPLEAGRDTARRVPGARLEVIEGLGHDVTPAVGAQLAGILARQVAAVEAAA